MTLAFVRKLTRKPTRLDHWKVTVYTRAECCCCHKAIELLQNYRKRHGFTIEEIDVDSDSDLRSKFDLTVPVVAINGKVRFKGLVSPVLLDRLISAEANKGK
jgi:glutaredoxin